MRKLFFVLRLFLLPALLISSQSVYSDQTSPYLLVKDTAQNLLLKLDQHSESSPQEYAAIVDDVLVNKVDFRTITKFVMGKQHYLGASENQRKAFQNTFQESLISTYSSGLSLLNGKGIEVLLPPGKPEKNITGVTVLVRNENGSIFQLRFTLRKDEIGSWKIINVILNGYNVAYAFHQQFKSALKKHNGDLDQLIANWNIPGSSPSNTQDASKYKASNIPGWKSIEFSGKTLYQQTNECVQAVASGSASGLIKEYRSDLQAGSKLRWSWKAEQLLQTENIPPEKSKQGDDFVARVFVIKEGAFPWQTKAINYVWSREHPVGDYWRNPFVQNAIMLVVQSGNEGIDEWKSFERDVKKDFKNYHDMDIDSVDAVALMSDTDQTGARASACYKPPYFG